MPPARIVRKWILLFIIGAFVGAGLDMLHVSFGALQYPGSMPQVQPLWVRPLFGGATVLFVASYKQFRSPGETGDPVRALVALVTFALAYLCTAVFHAHTVRLAAILVAAYVPLLVGPSWKRFTIYSALIALGGTLFEATIITLGAFNYLHPGPLPVPIWLPGLYLFAAAAARAVDLAYFA